MGSEEKCVETEQLQCASVQRTIQFTLLRKMAVIKSQYQKNSNPAVNLKWRTSCECVPTAPTVRAPLRTLYRYFCLAGSRPITIDFLNGRTFFACN
jgi:hypothetical protein